MKVYPEYYLLKINQFNNVSKDSLDEWIYFLKNMARIMRQVGEPVEKIVEYTQLTPEEVEGL